MVYAKTRLNYLDQLGFDLLLKDYNLQLVLPTLLCFINTSDGEEGELSKLQDKNEEQDLSDKSANESTECVVTNKENSDTTHMDKDNEEDVVEVKMELNNQSISDIAPIIKDEKECVIDHDYTDGHTDGEESAPKKRRIAASDLLQLSDAEYTSPISTMEKNENVSAFTLPTKCLNASSYSSTRNCNETSPPSRICDYQTIQRLSNVVRYIKKRSCSKIYQLSCSRIRERYVKYHLIVTYTLYLIHNLLHNPLQITRGNGADRLLLDCQLNEAAGINTWKSCYDAELPSCLLELCEPLECKLCGDITFNKPMDAATHYVGKRHNATTSKFLGEKSHQKKVVRQRR